MIRVSEVVLEEATMACNAAAEELLSCPTNSLNKFARPLGLQASGFRELSICSAVRGLRIVAWRFGCFKTSGLLGFRTRRELLIHE